MPTYRRAPSLDLSLHACGQKIEDNAGCRRAKAAGILSALIVFREHYTEGLRQIADQVADASRHPYRWRQLVSSIEGTLLGEYCGQFCPEEDLAGKTITQLHEAHELLPQRYSLEGESSELVPDYLSPACCPVLVAVRPFLYSLRGASFR